MRDFIAIGRDGFVATIGRVRYRLRVADVRRSVWEVSRADGRAVRSAEADIVVRRAEDLALLQFRGEPQ